MKFFDKFFAKKTVNQSTIDKKLNHYNYGYLIGKSLATHYNNYGLSIDIHEKRLSNTSFCQGFKNGFNSVLNKSKIKFPEAVDPQYIIEEITYDSLPFTVNFDEVKIEKVVKINGSGSYFR